MRTNDCTKSSLKYHFTTLSASGYQLESMAHDATINVFWYTASLASNQYPYLSWKRYVLKIWVIIKNFHPTSANMHKILNQWEGA